MFVWNPCARPRFRLSSDAAISHDTMLIMMNAKAIDREAALVASARSGWGSFDERPLLDVVLALAGRCAR
jgi:hypothetical protein